jgi:hypothetical protein
MAKITKAKAEEIKKNINYYGALLEVGSGVGAADRVCKAWKGFGGFNTIGGVLGGIGTCLAAGFSAAIGFKYLVEAAESVVDYLTDDEAEPATKTTDDEKEDSEEYDSEE